VLLTLDDYAVALFGLFSLFKALPLWFVDYAAAGPVVWLELG
jgi:hypothetical protein